MNDVDFEKIRREALEKIRNAPTNKQSSMLEEKIMNNMFEAASLVCSEMLQEYHKSLKSQKQSD